jgi:hypothetical protein
VWTRGVALVIEEARIENTLSGSGSTSTSNPYALFTGIFDGVTMTEVVATGTDPAYLLLENPTGTESWAGFANDNTDLYPINNNVGGACVTFTAALGFQDSNNEGANIKFKLENQVYDHPQNDFNLDVESALQTITGEAFSSYSVGLSQQAGIDYNSFILYLVDREKPVKIYDVLLTEGNCPT